MSYEQMSDAEFEQATGRDLSGYNKWEKMEIKKNPDHVTSKERYAKSDRKRAKKKKIDRHYNWLIFSIIVMGFGTMIGVRELIFSVPKGNSTPALIAGVVVAVILWVIAVVNLDKLRDSGKLKKQ